MKYFNKLLIDLKKLPVFVSHVAIWYRCREVCVRIAPIHRFFHVQIPFMQRALHRLYTAGVSILATALHNYEALSVTMEIYRRSDLRVSNEIKRKS